MINKKKKQTKNGYDMHDITKKEETLVKRKQIKNSKTIKKGKKKKEKT